VLQRINQGGTIGIAVLSLDLFTIYVVRLYGIPEQRVVQLVTQKPNSWSSARS